MTTTERDDESLFERIGATLREPSPEDAASEARLIARWRAETASERTAGPAGRRRGRGAGRAGGGIGGWLFRPRVFVLPPLVPIGTIGAVAALLLLWMRAERVPPPLPAPPARLVAEAPAIRPEPVSFVCVAPKAEQVSVVGDFNDWNPQAHPLERSGRQGAWSGLLWLPPGVYEYAFVIDGKLRSADDARPTGPPDDFGVSNSVLIVGAESI